MVQEYVVGYLSLFDGELMLERVSAPSKVDAMRVFLADDMYAEMSEDDIVTCCYDQDAFINVIEL